MEEEPGVILRRTNTKNRICGWDGWGLIVGTGEVLNVRRMRWIDVGNVNGCPNGGFESREATTGRSFKSEFKKHIRVLLNLEGLGWQSHLGN